MIRISEPPPYVQQLVDEDKGTRVIECRKCTAGACSHGAQCPMMIRWYDDGWGGTFWRRCECDAWVEPPQGYAPVTVRRIANHPGDTKRSGPGCQPSDRLPRPGGSD